MSLLVICAFDVSKEHMISSGCITADFKDLVNGRNTQRLNELVNTVKEE